MRIDETEIVNALFSWFKPGDVFEVRVLDAVTRAYYRPHIESGYFDFEHISAVPGTLSHISSAKGVYVTVNPVKPELLNRAVNRVRPAGREPTTADSDIIRRRWLLIDCDAKRASGIPSSDAEHDLAYAKAEEIRAGFASMGWGEPIVTDSGNGAQLMYRIDLPADDNGLVQEVLQNVAAVSSDAVDIDITVHNPARIWRLPGTMNCKGDSTESRPHRMAKILSQPEELQIVSNDQLCSACAPKQTAQVEPTLSVDYSDSTPSDFDLDEWISVHCSNVSGPQTWKDGRKWVFDVCPFNPDHTDKSAVITQQSNGAIGFTCHHNGCKDKDWKSLRDMLEPDRHVHREIFPEVDLSSFFEKIKQKQARKENPFDDPGALPDELLSIPGLINDIIDVDMKTAPYPNRTLAFCGALTFVAHLIGRKYRDVRNNFSNIYLIALANSGTGKDHPRKTNNDIGAMAGLSNSIGDSFVSGAALEDTMYVSPAQLFQMDEADWLFNTLKGAKDAAVSESINEKLLKFYSSSNSVYYMRKKAFKEKQTISDFRDNGFIYNPCLTIFGTAVPDYFYESLSKRVLENGLVARCLIVEVAKRGKRGTPGVVREHLTPELMERINVLAQLEVKQTPLGVPLPLEMPQTENAAHLLDRFGEECDLRYDGFEELHDLTAMALWARAFEKACKLAMLYAVSVNPAAPVVDTDAVVWATGFVSHVTRQLLFRAGQFCYTSESDRLSKRFLKRLHESGGRMSHSEIMRALHLSRTEMREIVETLIDSKQIEKFIDEEKTKPIIYYREV
jgi:hypothetical protein